MYELVESELFSHQVYAIGDPKVVDEALRVITWAMCNRPEMFPTVPGKRALRVAKTIAYRRGGVRVPRLIVWFKIHEKRKQVELLSIEPAEIEHY